MLKVALYNPQIPPNTGNISRLVVGLDLELILIKPIGFDLNDKQLKRAGIDYWKHLKLKICESYDDFLKYVNKNRIIYVSTKGKTPYYHFNFNSNDIILFGSENGGIPNEHLKKNLENTITIPMIGKVRSLNLSNSVAIVVYDALLKTNYFNDFSVNKKFYDLF